MPSAPRVRDFTPTSFPTVCTIFPDANGTLDIALNTLMSKSGILCLPVLFGQVADFLGEAPQWPKPIDSAGFMYGLKRVPFTKARTLQNKD